MRGSASRWADSLGNPNRPTILDRAADMARMKAAIRDHRAKRFPSRYAGWCDHCGDPVPVGTSIWWSQAAGVMHETCVDDAGIEQYRTSSQISQALNDADREVREAAEAQAEREWHEDRAGDEQ